MLDVLPDFTERHGAISKLGRVASLFALVSMISAVRKPCSVLDLRSWGVLGGRFSQGGPPGAQKTDLTAKKHR